MPTALIPLTKLQFGIESTPGTIVAADTVYIADNGGGFAPIIERNPLDTEVRGVLAIADDFDARGGSELTVESNLDFEQIMLPLDTGLASATPSGAGPYTRTYSPSLTAPNALKSATFEVTYTDGTTKHVEREFGYGHCRSFGIELAFNQPARLSAEFFGQADVASTVTPALAPLTREIARSNAFNVYINDTWLTLGDTEVTAGLVRSASLEVQTGVEPQYGIDSRTALDHEAIQRGMITGTLTLTMAVNSGFTAEMAKWRDGSLRFIRLYAAGSGSRELTIDMAGRYTGLSFGEDGGLRTAEMTFDLRYDPTSAKMIEVLLVNNVAAI